MRKITKIIKITDRFLVNHKNKIMLGSLAFILFCSICYFIVSADKNSVKILIVFLLSAAFLCTFYPVKFLLNIRNKFSDSVSAGNKFAGYINDIIFVFVSLFFILIFLYDFIFTFEGFNLIIFSIMSAVLNAVIFSRVKNSEK